MGQVEARLAELGLSVPDVVPPVASYVPARRDGRRVYVSGQLPMLDGALVATGKVGVGDGLVAPELATEAAQVCALNAIAALKSVVGDLDKVSDVVKVTGFVASDPSFTGAPAVINGASDLFGKVFGEAGIHARSAVGVVVLPLDAAVEVEAVFAIED